MEALWHHMALQILVQTDSGNGVLPENTKPIPEPMSTNVDHQLECLHSEDTPRRLMITHTIESYWIPSQKKTKWKLQI